MMSCKVHFRYDTVLKLSAELLAGSCLCFASVAYLIAVTSLVPDCAQLRV